MEAPTLLQGKPIFLLGGLCPHLLGAICTLTNKIVNPLAQCKLRATRECNNNAEFGWRLLLPSINIQHYQPCMKHMVENKNLSLIACISRHYMGVLAPVVGHKHMFLTSWIN